LSRKRRRVLDVEGDAAVVFKMAPRDIDVLCFAVDRYQSRGGVHPVEDPCGRKAGSGAEFEHRTARLRSRQGSQQRPGPGFTGHVETDRSRFALYRIHRGRRLQIGRVIHNGSPGSDRT